MFGVLISWKLSSDLSFLLLGISDEHIFFDFSNYCPSIIEAWSRPKIILSTFGEAWWHYPNNRWPADIRPNGRRPRQSLLEKFELYFTQSWKLWFVQCSLLLTPISSFGPKGLRLVDVGLLTITFLLLLMTESIILSTMFLISQCEKGQYKDFCNNWFCFSFL